MKLTKSMKQDIINYLGINPNKTDTDFKDLIDNYGGYELVVEVLVEQVEKIKLENMTNRINEFKARLEPKIEPKDLINYIYPEDLIKEYYFLRPNYTVQEFTEDYINDDYHSLYKKSCKYRINIYSNIIQSFKHTKNCRHYTEDLLKYKQTRDELDRKNLIETISRHHFYHGCNKNFIQFLIINNFKINIETLQLSKYVK